MKQQANKISDQLREVIRNSEKSRYQISKETGIAQSILSRFLNQRAGISLDSIDKLAECLNLEIVIRSRKGKHR